MMDYAKRHLQGHVGYYAVSGNTRSVSTYAHRISRLMFKWLNRRSQRRSVTWARFGKVLKDWMPSLRVRIISFIEFPNRGAPRGIYG